MSYIVFETRQNKYYLNMDKVQIFHLSSYLSDSKGHIPCIRFTMDDGDFFILACDDIDDEGRVIPLDTVLSGIDLLMKTDVNKIDIVLSENMYVYREIKIRYMEPIFYTSSLYNK